MLYDVLLMTVPKSKPCWHSQDRARLIIHLGCSFKVAGRRKVGRQGKQGLTLREGRDISTRKRYHLAYHTQLLVEGSGTSYGFTDQGWWHRYYTIFCGLRTYMDSNTSKSKTNKQKKTKASVLKFSGLVTLYNDKPTLIYSNQNNKQCASIKWEHHT